MTLFQIIAAVISFTAIVGVVGERLFKLPRVIGPMVVAALLSMSLVGLEAAGLDLGLEQMTSVLDRVDFGALVMDGLLGLLLFAGAMHLPIKLLEQQGRAIFGLAVVSTLLSTLVIGGLLWLFAGLLGLHLGFLQALVFGALISPTDPVAVLAVLKNASLPKRLEVIISGESLFNDGIGVVLFVILGTVAFGQAEVTVGSSFGLLVQEVGGGLLLGFAIGAAAYYLLENTSEQGTQVLITLSVATGGYGIAQMLHVSGPLAMVVAGLLVGNFGLRETMDRSARKVVDTFWNVTDDVLNAVLFVLVGIQALLLPQWIGWSLAALAVVCHLFGRTIGVLVSTWLLQPESRRRDGVWMDTVVLLSWSGLRGGVSLALVLTLPGGEVRDTMIGMTYAIVVFSLVVQGLSIGRLFRRHELRRIAGRARELR